MKTNDVRTEYFAGRRMVPLGKAREQTRASLNESFPEMVGDKTQRIGG